MFEGIILTTWPILWVSLVVLFLGGAIWAACVQGYRWLAIPALFLALVFGAAFIRSQTVAVVPVGQVMVVENTISGQFEGKQRPAGVTDVPFYGASKLYFPAVTNYEWCDQYHPAGDQSIAYVYDVCWYLNLSNVDWQAQVMKTGVGTIGEILAQKHNPLSDRVATVVRTKKVADMADQAKTAKELVDAASDVFDKSMPLNSVSIKKWDFENAEIGKAYDQAVLAQTGKLKALADQDTAKAEAQAAMTRAQTQNDVLALQTQGLNASMTALGIMDSQSRANVMQLQMWLQYLAGHPNGVTLVLSTGGSPLNTGPSIPAQPQPVSPTAAPKSNAQ